MLLSLSASPIGFAPASVLSLSGIISGIHVHDRSSPPVFACVDDIPNSTLRFPEDKTYMPLKSCQHRLDLVLHGNCHEYCVHSLNDRQFRPGITTILMILYISETRSQVQPYLESKKCMLREPYG
jgi:hypothetical protein